MGLQVIGLAIVKGGPYRDLTVYEATKSIMRKQTLRYNLRGVVRENRADVTDRGRPIPSIFWLFYTFDQ